MIDYAKMLPEHIEKHIGSNDLFIEIFDKEENCEDSNKPPLFFVHGAFTGSWMWSKYIPHFVAHGWKCYVINLRGHYKSRVQDLTKVTFSDYLEDIREAMQECEAPPIIIGFSMGGILCQKIAETSALKGLVIIDSCISREVYNEAPYEDNSTFDSKIIEPSPAREERFSIDESEDDIEFQKKYLTMESSIAFGSIRSFRLNKGISIKGSLITCPSLVVKAVSNEYEDKIGRETAKQLKAEYIGLYNKTHTGLLVGQKYIEVVNVIIDWLKGMTNL